MGTETFGKGNDSNCGTHSLQGGGLYGSGPFSSHYSLKTLLYQESSHCATTLAFHLTLSICIGSQFPCWLLMMGVVVQNICCSTTLMKVVPNLSSPPWPFFFNVHKFFFSNPAVTSCIPLEDCQLTLIIIDVCCYLSAVSDTTFVSHDFTA